MWNDPLESYRRLIKQRKREHTISVICGIIYALAIAGYLVYLLT